MKVIDGGTEELADNNSGAHSMSRLGGGLGSQRSSSSDNEASFFFFATKLRLRKLNTVIHHLSQKQKN